MGLCLRSSAAKSNHRERAVWAGAVRGLLVTLACVALLAPCPRPSLAAPQFAAPSRPYPTGAGSRWVTTGDLNLDGVPDLVTANSSDNTVSVLIGRGDGTFLPRVDSPTGFGPQRVMLADLNADGLLDAVTLNPSAGTVSVLLGNGGAGFGRLTHIRVPGLTSVAVADLDRDGLPDLVGAAGSAVSVMLGQGDGTFSPRVDVPIGHGVDAVAIGDLDGDGNPDLAVANPYAEAPDPISFSVMRGNGDGTFTAGAVHDFVPDPRFLSWYGLAWSIVLAADLNGDSRLDLVGAGVWRESPYDAGAGGINCFLGKGDGTFSGLTWIGAGLGVATGDLNGDRKADLVGTTESPSIAVVALGRGDGTFQGVSTSYGMSAVAIEDLDGDGQADMAGVNGGNTVSVRIGNGDGSFGPIVPTSGLSGEWCPTSVASGDLNGDGRLDLVVADATGTSGYDRLSSVSVLIADGRGWFARAGTYEVGMVDPVVAVGDLNGDQQLDLVGTLGSSMFVRLGDGSGRLGPEIWVAFDGVRLGLLAIGDLNRDGRGDLVVLGDPAGIAVLLGNGDGTFAAPAGYETGTSFSRGVVLEDLDGDGDPDLALAKSGAVSVMLGDGAGGFSPRTDFAVGNGPIALAAGDLNGDGRLDLVAVGAVSIVTLLGHGDGSFTFAGTFAVEGSGTPAIGDLDEDGVPDVALIVAGSVGVLPGAGDGTLGTPVLFGTGGLGPSLTLIHDWNGDGRPDLGVAHVGWQVGPSDPPYGYECVGALFAVLLNNSPRPPETPLVARMDARPGSCASPLNLRSRGVFPVTILGTADFDVREIDLSTVLLEGDARAVHHVYRDRLDATEAGQSECTCAKSRRDGREDLTLHFDTGALARAGLVRGRRQETRLTVTGRLASGRSFEASDCVVLVGSASPRPLEAFGGSQAALQGVRYEVEQTGPVELVVYDVRGRMVRRLVTGPQAAGTHEARWDATGVPSGIYFYRLATGPRVVMEKVLLMK